MGVEFSLSLNWPSVQSMAVRLQLDQRDNGVV